MKSILIFLLLLSCAAYAQQADSVPDKRAMHRFAVKWSPLHLMGYYPTVQVAVEHRLKDHVSMQWDAGFIVRNGDNESSRAFDKQGFKAKLDVRYYLPFGRSAFFFAPEVYYNYVNFKKSGTFGVACDDPEGGCDYYRFATYTVAYREPGINFKAGLFHRFGQHFCIEYHVGFGHRFIRYKEKDVPVEGSYQKLDDDGLGLFDFSPDHKSRNIMFPTTCFRLGYIFR